MDCLTRHTKEFIQILKPASKIITLMAASILFYSLPNPNTTAPRSIKYCFPCVSRRTCILCYPFHIVLTLFWLVCAIVNWRTPKATTNFILLIFCPKICRPKRCDSRLPYCHRPARHHPKIYSIVLANFWLVGVSSHTAQAIKIQGPVALSIFNFLDPQFAIVQV